MSPNLSFKISIRRRSLFKATLPCPCWQRLLTSSPNELTQNQLQSSAIVFVLKNINTNEKIKGRSAEFNSSQAVATKLHQWKCVTRPPPAIIRHLFVTSFSKYMYHIIQIKTFIHTIWTNALLSAAAVSQAMIPVRGCPLQNASIAAFNVPFSSIFTLIYPPIQHCSLDFHNIYWKHSYSLNIEGQAGIKPPLALSSAPNFSGQGQSLLAASVTGICEEILTQAN